MHHGTHHHTPLPITAQAIWDGQAILATDGSVKWNRATYTKIISTTNDTIGQDVTGGSLLPPSSAPYAQHASKLSEAAALYAALTWIAMLLTKYPDTTDNAGKTPALPILIDYQSVIDDITQPLNERIPIFQLLMPDYDITIQAI